MSDYSFSDLQNGQHIAPFHFDPRFDRLLFDATVDAGLVRLAEVGTALSITYGRKTIFLDTTSIAELALSSLHFANGGRIAIGDRSSDVLADWYGQDIDLSSSTVSNQLRGLGGADFLRGGSGDDLLVGNEALTRFSHVSRVGQVGAPTGTFDPTISADGRFVAFQGGWTAFGSENDTAADVLVKDMLNSTVSLKNQSSTGTIGNGESGAPVVSAGGSVVYHSTSTNLESPRDGSSSDIYLNSYRISQNEEQHPDRWGWAPTKLAVDGASRNPDIAAHSVVFESSTSNWESGHIPGTTDIYIKTLTSDQLWRVSSTRNGYGGNGDSADAQISNDGRFVVFESAATNLTANDTNGRTDVFVWEAWDGLVNLSDLMVGARNADNDVFNPDVAHDAGIGGMIVFETAKELVDADHNNRTDVYAYDMVAGTFQLVSSKADGAAVGRRSGDAAVSGDGRFVVFTSRSDDLVAYDKNGFADVFVKDLVTGKIALVSRSAGGASGNQSSGSAQISLGGEYIVFESKASNLADTDRNGNLSDVFRVSNPLLRDDTLAGGDGNDTYVVNRKDVIVEEAGGGIDLVRSSISWWLGANLEHLELTGTRGSSGTGNSANNKITGNEGNNELSGMGGNDMLRGGLGDDVLTGSAGGDTLVGGGGDDTFDFNALFELGLGSTRDVIRGWNAGDVIDLRGIDANPAVYGDQAFQFRGSNAFNGTRQVRYENGVLQFNTDADLAADYEIVITGTPPANLVAGSDLVL